MGNGGITPLILNLGTNVHVCFKTADDRFFHVLSYSAFTFIPCCIIATYLFIS